MADAVPQISLEVVGGPMDGLSYTGEKAEVYLGRAQTGKDRRVNEMVLSKDNYCSRSHAVVRLEGGQWTVQDLGSTSFSRIHGKTLDGSTPPEPLADPDYFIAGNTVVEFRTGSRNLPPPIPKEKVMLSGSTKKLLDRAHQQAARMMAHFVGVEHLFWAIADSEIPIIVEFFSGAKLEPKEVARQTMEFDRWTGVNAWIGTMLHSTTSFKPTTITETPRLDYLVTLAEEARKKSDEALIEPLHMLVAILQEGGSVPAELLSQLGLECRVLATMAMRMVTASKVAKAPTPPPREIPNEEPTPPPASMMTPAPHPASHPPPPPPQHAVAEPAPTAAPAKPKEPKEPKPERKLVDQGTWLQARGLMDALVATQVQYQLAEPGARFEALRAKIREMLSGIPGPKRQAVFEQLRLLFPVVESATPFGYIGSQDDTPTGEEGPASEAEAPSDDQALEGTHRGKAAQPEHQASIKDIFATRMDLRLEDVDGQAAIEALSQIFFQFALATEQFTTSVFQTLRGGSSGDSKYFLPFMMKDLRKLMKDAEKGESKATEAVREYLSDLQHWQMSLIIAYQKAADDWNEKIWERIKPETIRRDSGMGAAMAKFSPGTLWNTYEKKVRDMHPEVTADEFRQLVDQMAHKEFKRLSKPEKKK